MRPHTRRALTYLLTGVAGLVALTVLLPLVDISEPSRVVWIAAYALALTPVILLLHGSLLASRRFATTWILVLGAVAALSGVLIVLLARPEDLENYSGVPLSLALALANLFRILAAAAVGVALARHVSSVGVILLIVVVATVSDIFSVFAGPTRTLVEEDSPVLDLLLLVFPTFGSALGFALGVSDFVFLALFAAASRYLNLRYRATLVCTCSAAFFAVVFGLLLERPLPALPFIAIAFVLVNADLILASLKRRSRSHG